MQIGPILRAMKHNRTRVVLVVLEVALTLAIVTNCVHVILGEQQKMLTKSGFDDANIIFMRSRPFVEEFRESATIDLTVDADLRAIAAVPGVEAAANTNFQLWEGGGNSTTVGPAGTTTEPQRTQIYYATKDVTGTLGVRMIDGRGFTAGDHGIGTEPDPANKTVISKALADSLFPGQRAVGQSLQQRSATSEEVGDPTTIIGVFERFYNPYGMPGTGVEPIEERAMFLPARVGSYQSGIRYLIRTAPGTNAASVTADIEKRLTTVNPGRVFEFQTTPEKKQRWFSASNIVVTTLTCIIVALILVTSLGLLGLTSLAVSERTRQIGTRRALGATRGDILRHFLIENWLVTTAGIVIGVAGAYALNFLLVSHVSEVKLQWQIVTAGVALLWINGILSTVPPALRATRISPSIATRSV